MTAKISVLLINSYQMLGGVNFKETFAGFICFILVRNITYENYGKE